MHRRHREHDELRILVHCVQKVARLAGLIRCHREELKFGCGRARSFMSQGHHRIDLRCPVCGKVTGKQRHCHQSDRNQDECGELRRLNALEKTRQKSSESPCAGQTESNAGKQEPQTPASHQAQHVALFGAERSEEHTSELQSPCNLVCRLLLEKKKTSAMSIASP